MRKTDIRAMQYRFTEIRRLAVSSRKLADNTTGSAKRVLFIADQIDILVKEIREALSLENPER